MIKGFRRNLKKWLQSYKGRREVWVSPEVVLCPVHLFQLLTPVAPGRPRCSLQETDRAAGGHGGSSWVQVSVTVHLDETLYFQE